MFRLLPIPRCWRHCPGPVSIGCSDGYGICGGRYCSSSGGDCSGSGCFILGTGCPSEWVRRCYLRNQPCLCQPPTVCRRYHIHPAVANHLLHRRHSLPPLTQPHGRGKGRISVHYISAPSQCAEHACSSSRSRLIQTRSNPAPFMKIVFQHYLYIN